MDKTALGRKIRVLREAKGLTQEELASRAKVANRALQRFESGETNPRLDTIAALAEVLGTSVSELTAGAQKTPSLPQFDLGWAEAAAILHAISVAEPHRRLAGLYLLTKDERYLDQLRALPSGAQFAQVLKKVL